MIDCIRGFRGGTCTTATYSIDPAEADELEMLLLETADGLVCENSSVVVANDSNDFFSQRTQSFTIPLEPESEGNKGRFDNELLTIMGLFIAVPS